uniref:Uncharacterized protein n=1 Tax=Tanacetum cinerariifolium TaxID=118510 RepID=A0A6L2JRF8_TANCI|nr:hypothetical protein [Tanacetum cinerariifolium]
MRALNVGSLQMMKKKDIPPVLVSGSSENTKSTRFENQKAMVITSVKREQKSKKQVGSSSLRRSEIEKERDSMLFGLRHCLNLKKYKLNQSDEEEDSEDEDGTSTLEAKTSSNGDGGKEMVDRDKGVGKCSDEADGQSVQGYRARAKKRFWRED